MTTVAWRGNEMAADSQGQRHGMRTTAQKIHRVGDHVIGVSGTLCDCLAFVRWFEDRSEPLDFKMYRNDGSDAPDVSAIVASPEGPEYWTEHCQPTPILDEFAAVGSGAAAALAAMHMGASAAEAVRIASLVDPGTGGEIQVMPITQKDFGDRLKRLLAPGRPFQSAAKGILDE